MRQISGLLFDERVPRRRSGARIDADGSFIKVRRRDCATTHAGHLWRPRRDGSSRALKGDPENARIRELPVTPDKLL
jgi:hypothetical protein